MKNSESSSESSGIRLLIWLIGLLAALTLLRWLGGDPRLAPPAFTDPSSWPAWAGGRNPLDAVFGLARSLLVALDLYLLAVTVLGLVIRWTGAVRAARLLERVTIPAVRPLLHSVVGVGFAVSTVTTPAVAMAAPRLDPPPSVTQIVDTPPAASFDGSTQGLDGPPLLRRLPNDDLSSADTAPPTTRSDAQPEARTRLSRVAPTPSPGNDTSNAASAATWVVQAGDHLWSIAERTLTGQLGQQADERTVTRYWKRLVAINRDTLVDPDNPDFILPGQVFRLPTPAE